MDADLRIDETCSCGASISVVGSKYRRDQNARNPRGAEEVVEGWRKAHEHKTAPSAALDAAEQGQDGGDGSEGATGRVELVAHCECGHTERDHRWGHNPRLYGTCPIYGCPCVDYAYATTKEPRP